MSAFDSLSNKTKTIKLVLLISLVTTVLSTIAFFTLDKSNLSASFFSVLYYVLFAGIYVSAIAILVLLILRILKALQL